VKLYDYPKSGNGYKVRLLLAHLAIPYRYLPLDILQGETRTQEFLARNPNGKIPVLELDDGRILAESNAILYWLAQNTPYWPAASFAQSQVLQWLFFEQYSHEPNIAAARFWISIRGLDGSALEAQQLEQKHRAGNAALAVMEQHLQERPFFVDDTYSIADIALYAYTHVAGAGGFELHRYPAVQAWLERVRSQPEHVRITDWQAG